MRFNLFLFWDLIKRCYKVVLGFDCISKFAWISRSHLIGAMAKIALKGTQ
jgi:tetrahydromethanopterin S-methyltransferase subunit E